ncbi:hypothetical protein MK139_17120 [bacterium]|nr:hypothetical protein [bacterium]
MSVKFDPRGWVIFACLVMAAACKPIPTAPEGSDEIIDRTYTNSDWGFSISAPQDSVWSLAARQVFNVREPNGLAPVQVILRRANPGSRARPVFELNSWGLASGQSLDDTATYFEEIFERNFTNYIRQGQKTTGIVAGVRSIEWRFRSREHTDIHYLNNRFLSVIFGRGDQVYQVLCSGQDGGFPETEFRSIMASFQFSK